MDNTNYTNNTKRKRILIDEEMEIKDEDCVPLPQPFISESTYPTSYPSSKYKTHPLVNRLINQQPQRKRINHQQQMINNQPLMINNLIKEHTELQQKLNHEVYLYYLIKFRCEKMEEYLSTSNEKDDTYYQDLLKQKQEQIRKFINLENNLIEKQNRLVDKLIPPIRNDIKNWMHIYYNYSLVIEIHQEWNKMKKNNVPLISSPLKTSGSVNIVNNDNKEIDDEILNHCDILNSLKN